MECRNYRWNRYACAATRGSQSARSQQRGAGSAPARDTGGTLRIGIRSTLSIEQATHHVQLPHGRRPPSGAGKT